MYFYPLLFSQGVYSFHSAKARATNKTQTLFSKTGVEDAVTKVCLI